MPAGRPRKHAPVPSDAAERVKWCLEELGIPAAELGRRTGLDATYLSRLLSGQRGQAMSPRVVLDVPEALGVPARWLWLGEGPPPDLQPLTVEIPARKSKKVS